MVPSADSSHSLLYAHLRLTHKCDVFASFSLRLLLAPNFSLSFFLSWFLSAGCDNVVILWNVARGESVVRIDSVHTDLIYSACWNRNGSQILTACKDKKLRVFDPRKGTVIKVRACPLCKNDNAN